MLNIRPAGWVAHFDAAQPAVYQLIPPSNCQKWKVTKYIEKISKGESDYCVLLHYAWLLPSEGDNIGNLTQ